MKKDFIVLGAIIALVIVAVVIGSNYYRSSIQKESVVGNSNSGGKPKVSAEQLVRPDSPSLGPADAKVTLVEFYDPECESCAAFAPIIKKLLKDNEGKLRLVTRYMPLHPNSLTAANFNEAAAEQGKYWEAREILFRKQPEWGTKHGPPTNEPPPNITALFAKYAKELGLDQDKASASIKAKKFDAKIEQDRKDGQALGVRKTPTFFVNGRELATFGESYLRALIDEEMRK